MNKTIKFVALMLCLTSSSLFYACDIGTSAEEKQKKAEAVERQKKAESIERKIFSAEDFCKFTTNTIEWYEIQDVIQCMSDEKIKKILEEYRLYFGGSYTTLVDVKYMANSFAILFASLSGIYIPDSDGFYKWYINDFAPRMDGYMDDSPWDRFQLIIGGKYGRDAVLEKYTKEVYRHGVLYKGEIITLEEAYNARETMTIL